MNFEDILYEVRNGVAGNGAVVLTLDAADGGNPEAYRLDITPDEYEPFAILSALDEASEEVAQVRVAPDFRLNTASATAWIVSGFARPGGKAAFDY